MPTVRNISVTSRVLVYQERDGNYVAHAIETDLIGEGASPNKAMTDLKNALEAQITFALQIGKPDMIYRQAPAEIVTRWDKAARQSIRDLAHDGDPLHVKAVATVIEITPREVAALRAMAMKKAYSQPAPVVACA